jgi:hypothetical protein
MLRHMLQVMMYKRLWTPLGVVMRVAILQVYEEGLVCYAVQPALRPLFHGLLESPSMQRFRLKHCCMAIAGGSVAGSEAATSACGTQHVTGCSEVPAMPWVHPVAAAEAARGAAGKTGISTACASRLAHAQSERVTPAQGVATESAVCAGHAAAHPPATASVVWSAGAREATSLDGCAAAGLLHVGVHAHWHVHDIANGACKQGKGSYASSCAATTCCTRINANGGAALAAACAMHSLALLQGLSWQAAGPVDDFRERRVCGGPPSDTIIPVHCACAQRGLLLACLTKERRCRVQ